MFYMILIEDSDTYSYVQILDYQIPLLALPLGGIQQLCGQEGGEGGGGQQKVHACPPREGGEGL